VSTYIQARGNGFNRRAGMHGSVGF